MRRWMESGLDAVRNSFETATVKREVTYEKGIFYQAWFQFEKEGADLSILSMNRICGLYNIKYSPRESPDECLFVS